MSAHFTSSRCDVELPVDFREEEENNLPQMKKLFFLYIWLNLTRIAELRKEDLVKHIRKRTIQTGRLFFSSSLNLINWWCTRKIG